MRDTLIHGYTDKMDMKQAKSRFSHVLDRGYFNYYYYAFSWATSE